MRQTGERIQALTGGWPADRLERRRAPGKWTARQLLTHLAQTEMALGARARMALTTPGYEAQPIDQDQWMALESRLGGRDALDAFLAASRMNVTLFEALSTAQRAVALSHPEYGVLTVDWIIHQMAGHQIHHLNQLEEIARL
jgi:hypothetical protein